MPMKTPRHGYGMGWRRQLMDHRDLHFAASASVMANLPPQVDLRPGMPPVYDQGDLGSCVGNGVAAVLQYTHLQEQHPDAARTPSRLMLYYLARYLEGTVGEDAGAEIRDGIKAAVKWGTAFEDHPDLDTWPYTISKYRDRPPQPCFDAAAKFHALEYRAIHQFSHALRGCLASGLPIVFGFSVFSAMEDDAINKTGILTMPAANDELLGGHCVVAVGYDDVGAIGPARHFLIRNSWGPDWSPTLGGYFWMPAEYIERPDLASDFWAVAKVS